MSLRKIDARKRMNLEMEKNKSPIDAQLEMLDKDVGQSPSNQYEGNHEQLKYNTDGKPKAGILPVFTINYEKIGGTVESKIERVDGDENKRAKYKNRNRDVIPSKGLYDIAQDILDQEYQPQSHMTEDMRNWEGEFDRDLKKAKIEQKIAESNMTPTVKKSNYTRRAGMFLSHEDAKNSHFKTLEKSRTNIALPAKSTFSTHKNVLSPNDSLMSESSTVKSPSFKSPKVKIGSKPPNIKIKLNPSSNLKFGTKSPCVKLSKSKPKSHRNSLDEFKPLQVMSKQSMMNQRASLDWKDYAQMRIPYLPTVMKPENTPTVYKSHVALPNLTKHKRK